MTISCASCSSDLRVDLKDQYNQYYAQYVTMFHAYATEIVALNTNATIGRNDSRSRLTGPGLLSYADFINYVAKMWSRNDDGKQRHQPADLELCCVARASDGANDVSPYYNIANGLSSIKFTGRSAGYATTASDYATLWSRISSMSSNAKSV